ncbi:MEDS domain-containing protein [[Mycobacterium] vasticus]|uniref:MEDS domain-containing protein n=1 Tax=[Mycobacterium] vasticus TaxID=2875777 RepID=A0ABU5YYI8_9MYCO|nr:MEDS domain-containing protein [Mycolicibacter sp. MYC017]MEB3069980.1 MEDS domain-containing protein [Mycolicibacter sp. MYC017]
MSIGRQNPTGEFGHLGWAYTDHGEFLHRAAQYLEVGLNLGQQVAYVGDDDPSNLRAGLAAAGLGADAGDVDVKAVPEHFIFQARGDVVDAERMAERYASAARAAVARGYNGLRVVVDVTAVARTPAQREAQAALEILGGRRISTLPVAAMCAYDATELGDGAADGLLCLHPMAGPAPVPFQLYGQSAQHNAIALAGHLDAAGESLFAAALQRILPLVKHPTVDIDARNLEFVGHRQLSLLDRCCAAHGLVAVLRSDRPVVQRLVNLLGFDNVRVGMAGWPSSPMSHDYAG